MLLYTRSESHAKLLQQDRTNQRYLPDVLLPDAITACSDLSKLAQFVSDAPALLIIATSFGGLISSVEALKLTFARLDQQPPVIVNLAKGLLPSSGERPSQLCDRLWPQAQFASLSGPSFAIEVAQGLPTAIAVAHSDPAIRQVVIQALHHDALRIYGSTDVVGVELAAALKNVIAIAAGACDGLNLGFNARAALITRGLAEMARLGQAMGAQAETFQGLVGLGDLVLTCTGNLSRNRQVGLRLAQGQSLDQILIGLGHVAEGVHCAAAARVLLERYDVQAPIISAINQVIFEGLPAAQAVTSLLARQPKDNE